MNTAALGKPIRLGNILIERGVLTVDQLQSALDYQKSNGKGKLLGEILIELELCSEEQILECLAEGYGIPYAVLDQRLHDTKTLDFIDHELIDKYQVFPLFCIRDVLTIAVTEPSNLFLLEELQRITGKEVQIVATSPKDIRRMISTLPDSSVFVLDDIIEDDAQTEVTLIENAVDDIGELEDVDGQSPVIRLVNYMISNAVKDGASDIHVEPTERCLRIRNRIDGRLYKSLEVPTRLHNAVTSRIKIMASLDISERRLPQDGRVHVMLDGRKIDLRVSTFPGSRGEKTVIRVLDTRNVSLNLRDLGFSEIVLKTLQEQIHAPNGIVLVTGPTGSGKSTTLYSALNEIATMANNICTVEDPIEYHLSMINQFQVQEKIGLTFSKALRTLLRQDPDVIMLGEIRDEETARTAIQAALTGHLVCSTLHTNDAPSAVTRLVNMGVETYLISAALNMVLAQRLVRKVCFKCRKPFDPPRQMRRILESLNLDPSTLFKGVGCRRCRNSGFSGRVGLHELLMVNDELRDAIVADASVTDIRRMAVADGMISMEQDGLHKVREGMTTIEEVMQVAGQHGLLVEAQAAAN
jgi:type IV pilus assembly protein PilB